MSGRTTSGPRRRDEAEAAVALWRGAVLTRSAADLAAALAAAGFYAALGYGREDVVAIGRRLDGRRGEDG